MLIVLLLGYSHAHLFYNFDLGLTQVKKIARPQGRVHFVQDHESPLLRVSYEEC